MVKLEPDAIIIQHLPDLFTIEIKPMIVRFDIGAAHDVAGMLAAIVVEDDLTHRYALRHANYGCVPPHTNITH